MKRNRIFLMIFALGFFLCGTIALSLAGEEEEITVIGVIKKSNLMDYVVNDNEKYRIIGQDFGDFIGRKMKITGKKAAGHGENTLLVTYMEFVEN